MTQDRPPQRRGLSILLKSLVFYPLLWFRGIVLLLLGIIAGCTAIAGILLLIECIVVGPHLQRVWVLWTITGLMFGINFACLIIRINYNVLLVKLNPTGLNLQMPL